MLFVVKAFCFIMINTFSCWNKLLTNIKLAGVEGHCKLWIGDEIVLDTGEESALGSFGAIENVLFEIKIEYSLVSDRFFSNHFTHSNLTASSLFLLVCHDTVA